MGLLALACLAIGVAPIFFAPALGRVAEAMGPATGRGPARPGRPSHDLRRGPGPGTSGPPALALAPPHVAQVAHIAWRRPAHLGLRLRGAGCAHAVHRLVLRGRAGAGAPLGLAAGGASPESVAAGSRVLRGTRAMCRIRSSTARRLPACGSPSGAPPCFAWPRAGRCPSTCCMSCSPCSRSWSGWWPEMVRSLLPTMLQFLLHGLTVLLLPPLLPGLIAKTKALMAGRKGPPVLQLYYDLAKLARKQAVFSRTTTWVFLAGPVGGVAAGLAASCLVPFGHTPAPVSLRGRRHPLRLPLRAGPVPHDPLRPGHGLQLRGHGRGPGSHLLGPGGTRAVPGLRGAGQATSSLSLGTMLAFPGSLTARFTGPADPRPGGLGHRLPGGKLAHPRGRPQHPSGAHHDPRGDGARPLGPALRPGALRRQPQAPGAGGADPDPGPAPRAAGLAELAGVLCGPGRCWRWRWAWWRAPWPGSA